MRTFLSAVSLLLVATCGWAESAETPQLTRQEETQWKNVEPSVAMVYRGPLLCGAAALLTDDGWFLAHASIVSPPAVRAKLANGRTIVLKIRAADTSTQLVLLKAEDWQAGMGKPVKLATEPIKEGEMLFAVIPSGVIRAQFVSGDRLGVVGPSRRLLPLGEIKFEAPADKVGGALVFSVRGELVGAMQATLATGQRNYRVNDNAFQSTFANNSGGGGSRTRGAGGSTESLPVTAKSAGLNQKQGPAEMTTAYIVGLDALKRVVDAFKSPSREVQHPTLGIVCHESGGNGALIERVQVNSPAERAGLKPNDILEELAGIRIRNQVDFAKAMLRQEVGKTIQLKVRRDGRTLVLTVIVGKGETRLMPSP